MAITKNSLVDELMFLRDNGVDLGDEERAFVTAAIAQVRAGVDQAVGSAILETVGLITVMSEYVGDKWDLISEEFYPDYM